MILSFKSLVKILYSVYLKCFRSTYFHSKSSQYWRRVKLGRGAIFLSSIPLQKIEPNNKSLEKLFHSIPPSKTPCWWVSSWFWRKKTELFKVRKMIWNYIGKVKYYPSLAVDFHPKNKYIDWRCRCLSEYL